MDQWEFRLAAHPSTEIADRGGMAAASQEGLNDLGAKDEHALAERVYFGHGATEQENAISLLRAATLALTVRAREGAEISLDIDRGRRVVFEAIDAAEARAKLIKVLPRPQAG